MVESLPILYMLTGKVATIFFGGSGDLIESFGGGISFIPITLFFDFICLACLMLRPKYIIYY